jgi:hypothetical protein
MTMNSGDKTTRQLAVNAAFLKDIKDDNRDLKRLLAQLDPLVGQLPLAINHWPELVQLLDDLRDQLAMHFALEEAYGYFEDAIVSAPQLSVTAQCLRGQHTHLFTQICELADHAVGLSADAELQIQKLLNRIADFRQEFEQHEEAELQLILDALGEDIGVGD